MFEVINIFFIILCVVSGIERSATLPSMAAVMMSNNNINTKPETQVIPSPKPEKPKKTKNSIKFWILKVNKKVLIFFSFNTYIFIRIFFSL